MPDSARETIARPAPLGPDALRGLSVEALQTLVVDRDAQWATALTSSEAETSQLILSAADAAQCSRAAREIFRRATR